MDIGHLLEIAGAAVIGGFVAGLILHGTVVGAFEEGIETMRAHNKQHIAALKNAVQDVKAAVKK